jgi:hypothetical protein
MDNKKIIEFLKENELTDIEELEYKENVSVLRFYYDFDDEELASAKAYANDECEGETESDEWYDEYFLPYINDLAIDNVGEILEESIEASDLQVQYISYEADAENYDYCEFIAVYFKENDKVEIETILDELNL